MSLHPVRVKQDSVNGGTYNYRAKAAQLWRDSLEGESLIDGISGSRERSDFMGANSGTKEWVLADIGTVTPTAFATVAKKHGYARLSTSATTFAEGCQIIRSVPATNVMIDTSGRQILEFSLDNGSGTAAASLAQSPGLFCGYFNATGTTDGIITVTTGAMTTSKGYIGFFRTSDAGTLGTLQFKMASDNGGTVSAVTVLTAAEFAALVTSTNHQVNLGFAVNARGSVELYVNGEYKKTASEALSLAALPVATLALTPALAIVDYTTSGALGSVAIDADWYESFQAA